MSRGFRRSAGSFRAREGAFTPVPGDIPSGGRFEQIVDATFKSYYDGDAKTVEAIDDFFNEMNFHIRGELHAKKGGKEDSKLSKLNIVKAFNNLPAQVRELLFVPPEKLKGLYRGVSDMSVGELPKIGWTNGNFVFGFTPDKNLAERFSDGEKEGMVITTDAYQGTKGGIDLVKFSALIESMNDMLAQSFLKTDKQREEYKVKMKKAFEDYGLSDFMPTRIRTEVLHSAVKDAGGDATNIMGDYIKKAFNVDLSGSAPFFEKEVLVFGVKLPASAIRKQK